MVIHKSSSFIKALFQGIFTFLPACNAKHSQDAAADEQSSQPTDEVAAVTGLGRTGILGDDRILAALGAANGAFLVLDAGGLLGSGLVDHPLEAVCCRVGLVAALALMPVVGAVILPLRAVAVGMAGRRILIGGFNLHITCGHGEGGGCLGGVCRGDIALQHDPLVKDLACLRCVRRNGHNGVLLDLVGDGGASGNGGRALDNRERIRLYGVFGELRLDRYIVCGHGEGGGGAGLVSQRNAACLNDPLDEVHSVRSLCRNGDLNALHGAGDGCACGNGGTALDDRDGVLGRGRVPYEPCLAAVGAPAGVENPFALALCCGFAAVPVVAELINDMTVAENLSAAGCALPVAAIACGGASGLNLIDQLGVIGNFVEGRGRVALLSNPVARCAVPVAGIALLGAGCRSYIAQLKAS